MTQQTGTLALWRLHETVRPGMQSDEILAMARRGELSPMDRVRRGNGPWREVGSLESLRPIMDSMLGRSDIREVLQALRSEEPASIELGLAKARALGLIGMPWLAAVMLEAALRMREESQLPTVLVILDSLAAWPGILGYMGRELHNSQASHSSHVILPSEVIDYMVSDGGHARLLFDVMRRLVTDPCVAGALTQRLWDEPDPDDSNAKWIRSVLRSAEPASLLRALADHDARSGAQSVFLETWMLHTAAGSDPADHSWGGVARRSITHRRAHICIEGGASGLSEAGLATLLAWFEPAWWESLVVRNLAGGTASLLQAAHDGLVHGNELRLDETEEFQEDDPDEGMKAGESRLIAPISFVLRLQLARCSTTPGEVSALRLAVPNSGYFTVMEIQECPDLPDEVLCWLAAHSFDALARGETPPDWELDSRSGTLSIESMRRPVSFDGVRGSPLWSLDLSDVPMGELPASVMRGASFPRLERLRMKNCGLSTLRWGGLPEPFIGPMTLRKIDLSGNRITTVSGELDELPKIEWIDLSDNAIHSIDVRGCIDMPKTLLLARNPLRSAPEINCQTTYDLTGTLVTEFPAFGNDRCELEHLSLPSTLRSIPARIAELGSLKTLELDNAQLVSIPAELFMLDELESVQGLWGDIEIRGVEAEAPSDADDDADGDDVIVDEEDADVDDDDAEDSTDEDFVQVAVFGDGPETLEDRQSRLLVLRASMQGVVPPDDDGLELDESSMVQSSRWIQVMLDAAGHVTLPHWIARLDVIGLWLSSFGGVRLPDWLSSLPELRELHLSGSRLEELPTELFVNELMETIACDSPALARIEGRGADRWGSRLETLDLTGSGVASLPESMAGARGLKHLLLNDTRINALPATLLGLPLERLSIAGCPITSLPKGRTGLEELHTLEAAGSRLEALPEWIGGCRSLVSINLRGAPIRSVPASVLACQDLMELAISRDAPLDAESRSVLSRLGNGRVKYCAPDE
ncbi:MAG: hypothetical protein FJX76_24005 [Armatimonadetes bacterium]|nr:hypothetical protein [Armatimonadota bacterium]